MPIFSPKDSLIILSIAGFLGIAGWAAARTFVQIAISTAYYFRQASAALKDAREQQAELFQIRDDLIKANEELARLSNRLKAMQQVAEEARQAKTEFVANVSHEFRAPLNMIVGYSEVITSSPRAYGGKIPTALLADIGVIHRNAIHLSRLVDDVLDLSQIEVGRMAISREMIDISPVVEAAAAAIRPLFESKGLFLHLDLQPGLPRLFCDSTRIRQIIVNLLSNAGRFTRQGGVTVTVRAREQDVLFSVTDTGTGIPKEQQSKIFQPFNQGDTSIRREYGGSGLGLNISKHFVELHGGKIWLESEPGQGTAIAFTLPLDAGMEKNEPPTPAARRWVSEYAVREARSRPFKAPHPAIRPRFVVVESGSSMNRLFSRYAENIDIHIAHSMKELESQLEQATVQLVLYNTPDVMDPATVPLVAAEIARLPGEMPFIACWLPGREDVARELGVLDYLVKPVSPQQMLEVIGRECNQANSILVVEDEPDLLRLFVRVLSSSPAGYRILRAENGEAALEEMRTRQPDLVLLDLVMPEKSGYEVITEKRKDPRIENIPVIVISATDPVRESTLYGPIFLGRRNGIKGSELIDFSQMVSFLLAPEGAATPRTAGQVSQEAPRA